MATSRTDKGATMKQHLADMTTDELKAELERTDRKLDGATGARRILREATTGTAATTDYVLDLLDKVETDLRELGIRKGQIAWALTD